MTRWAFGRRATAGMTLGVVILVIFICLTFALSLAGMATLHLNMASRLLAQTKARDLVESTIAITVAQVMANPKFGNSPSDPAFTVGLLDNGSTWTPSGLPGARLPQAGYVGEGLATFDTSAALGLSMPFSLNNLSNQKSAIGWDGRSIPAQTLHVAAMGVEGTERLAIEALIMLPPFPFALAASGAIHSSGNLVAASVPCSCATGLCVYHMCPKCLGPSDVGANSCCPTSAIALAASQINGCVDAVGGIASTSCTVVDGGVNPHHAPICLPFIDVPGQLLQACEYPNVQTLTSMPAKLTGINQYKGCLSVGGLVLCNAVLFVKGNLVVTGGITGVGAVFVQGAATIQGISSLTSDDVSAVIAEGPITLTGSASTASFFQGMVYSSASVTASNVTVLGNLVSNAKPLPCECAPLCPVPKCQPPPGPGTVCLTNVRVISALNPLHCAAKTSSKVYLPPVSVRFGCQTGVGDGTYLIGFKGPEVGSFLGIICSGGMGGEQRGCLNALGLACCNNGGCTESSGCGLFGVFGTCECAQCPIVYCVRPVPCPPTGPIAKVCISAGGGHHIYCYPMSKSEVQAFITNCLDPKIEHELRGSVCLLGCYKRDFCAGRELKQLPKIQMQVWEIMCYHSTCGWTTQEMINRCGYLFDMNWNQFLGLASQMRVLYWADVDASKLEGPPDGSW